MSNIRRRGAISALSLMIPCAAWADLSGIATVPANSALNLDTGAVATSGGDLLFNGSKLTAQGSAKAIDAGNIQLSGFNIFTQGVLQSYGPGLSNLSFTASVGDVFVVLTNGGNYSKALVTALSASSVTLQYLTYGSSAAPSGPAITAVQNNYSYLQVGLPNYGIAPGTLFIIKGTDLANPGTAVLQSSGGSGIPTSLNGASISVTVNGVTTHPAMYYAIPTQIAAVLPSSTPVGTGTITVTYNGTTSSAAAIQVVATALGFDTYFGSGTGLGVATNASSGAVFNYTNSATPGQTIVLWASGLGADSADSDTVFTSSPHAVNVPLQIYIGGIPATILYQGSSGYPGLNQIDVTIPPSVQPGCGVSIVAISGSIVSNTVSIPVTAGGGVCSDPALGVSTQTVSLNGGSYKFGSVAISQETASGTTGSTAGANFVQVGGAQSTNGGGLNSIGNCYVSQSVIGATAPATTTGLDAGTVTVTGPSGTQSVPAITSQPGTYDAILPAGFIPAGGASFTFTGTGGKDVGAFTATVKYSNPLTWTNMSSITSVNRSQGVTVTWTGGDPNSYVLITGGSTSPANANGANGIVAAGFFCDAPVAAGKFTVPSYVLLGMPAGTGSLNVENATTPVAFSASGLDYAYGFVAISSAILPTYQ